MACLLRPSSRVQFTTDLAENAWSAEGGRAAIFADGALDSEHKSRLKTQWVKASNARRASQLSDPLGNQAGVAKRTAEAQQT
jgi:hypothetical protein